MLSGTQGDAACLSFSARCLLKTAMLACLQLHYTASDHCDDNIVAIDPPSRMHRLLCHESCIAIPIASTVTLRALFQDIVQIPWTSMCCIQSMLNENNNKFSILKMLSNMHEVSEQPMACKASKF